MGQATAPIRPDHPDLINLQAGVIGSLDAIIADISDLITAHPIAATELPGLADHVRRARAVLAVVDEEYADRARTGRWSA